MWRFVLFLLIVTLPGASHAQGYTDLAWSAFDPGDDFTAQVIRSAFGVGVGAGGPIANQSSAFGVMLGLFTAAVGIIVLTVFLYSTVMELVRAGDTGELIDKHNKVLAPLRMVFALVMMIPSPATGLSLGQHLVIQTALSSIGIVRTLYTAGIRAMGPDALPITEPMIPGTKSIVAGLISNELCRAMVNVATNNPRMMPAPQPIRGGLPQTGAYVTWAYSLAPGNETGAPLCGTVTVRQPSQAANTTIAGVSVDMTDTQRTVLESVVAQSIRAPVEQIAATLWQTRQASALAPLMNVYVTATDNYTRQLTAAATSITRQLRAALTADQVRAGAVGLQQNQDRLASLGWSGAGAYALEIARLNGSTLSLLSATPIVTTPTYRNLGPNLSADLAPMLHAALEWRDRLMTFAQTTDGMDAPSGYSDLFTGASPGDDGAGVMERVARAMRLNERVLNLFVTALSPTGTIWQNPFLAQTQLGHKLVVIAVTALGLASALASTTASAGMAAVNVLTLNFSGAAATAVGYMAMQFLATPIFWGLMCLLGPGLLLAFVLPMLPFAMWFAGVLGWLILVIEAVIAVPLWMWAHMTWRGDGLHGNGIEGWGLIANILFRPALMLFGLFAGFILYAAAAWLIQQTFSVAASFVLQNGWLVSNLLGVVVLVCLFVVFHIVASTQSFRLISLAPHHIVRLAGIASANRVDMDSVSQQLGALGAAGAIAALGGGMSQALEAVQAEARQRALASPAQGGGMDRTVAAATEVTPPPDRRPE